jgi:hypothetical protein
MLNLNIGGSVYGFDLLKDGDWRYPRHAASVLQYEAGV